MKVSTDDHHARQRPAFAPDRARQGPRYLRRRRRSRAAADHRPHQRLRRGDGRDHPDEGRGADPDQRVVVRSARGRGAASHDQRRRRCHHQRSAGAEGPSRLARRARDAVPAHHGVSDRMRDPRLSFRLGVEGICRAGHAGGRETAARPLESAKLEPAIFSPATKAETGHDENITVARMREIVGDEVSRYAGEHGPRGLCARRKDQPRPRHHHRRHQIRIRPRSRWAHHPDRRGDDPRQFAVLGGGCLPARPAAAEFRQAAAARLSRRRAPRRPLERRSAAAAAARRASSTPPASAISKPIAASPAPS